MSSEKKYLFQAEVAERWQISERTLERWRWQGRPPKFLKFGSAVRYDVAEIERCERAWAVGELEL